MRQHIHQTTDGNTTMTATGRLHAFAVAWHVGCVPGDGIDCVREALHQKVVEAANICLSDGATRGSLELVVNPRVEVLLSPVRLEVGGTLIRVRSDEALPVSTHSIKSDLAEVTIQTWGLEAVIDAGGPVEVDWDKAFGEMGQNRPYTHMVPVGEATT